MVSWLAHVSTKNGMMNDDSYIYLCIYAIKFARLQLISCNHDFSNSQKIHPTYQTMFFSQNYQPLTTHSLSPSSSDDFQCGCSAAPQSPFHRGFPNPRPFEELSSPRRFESQINHGNVKRLGFADIFSGKVTLLKWLKSTPRCFEDLTVGYQSYACFSYRLVDARRGSPLFSRTHSQRDVKGTSFSKDGTTDTDK